MSDNNLSIALSYIRSGEKISPTVLSRRLKITIAAARILYYDALAALHIEARKLAMEMAE